MLNSYIFFTRQKKKILLFISFLFFSLFSFAQEVTVNGTVFSEGNVPLEGVSVSVRGTSIGTTTNTQGKFTVTVSKDAALVFSFLGYQEKKVTVANSGNIGDIQLVPSTSDLGEVVVVGYGTQKKENLTGAVSSINFENKNINSRTLTNLSSALSGMSSGTFVTQNNGLPSGDGATITIRGAGSLNASQQPLVIVDGVVGDINSVNTNDIASVSILKDAASSAIYGSRASNGVILITTKSGSNTNNKVTFNYNGFVGFSKPTENIELVTNTADHMELINLLQLNSGFAAPFTQDQIDEWRQKSKTDPLGYPNTDWWAAIIKPNVVQSHSLSAQGGNEKLNFFSSFDFFDNDGLISNTAYKKLTFRNNLTYKITDWLQVGNIATFLSGKADPVDVSTIFTWWRATTPGMVPKSPDGRYGASQTPALEFQSNNVLHSAETTLGERNTRNYTGKFFGILTPLKGLKITASYFLDRTDYDGWTSHRPTDRWNFQTNTVQIDNTSGAILALSNFYNKTERQVFDLYADYDLSIKNHAVHLLAGYNQEYYKYSTLGASKNELLSLDIPVLNAATGTPTATGDITDYAMRSYFGRINYAFKDKYLFESNIRYDGSSRFSPQHRWGVFPSFSAGWQISKENFWEDIRSKIDELKIRASWGQLGNNGIGNYEWQNAYQTVGYSFNGRAVPAVVYNSLANDAITWETTNISNIGLDVELFSKLSATLNYYNKYTKGILANTPIPYVNGGITAPRVNSAAVRNTGFELELSYNTKIGNDFFIRAGVMGSYNKNKIVKYKGDYLEPHGVGLWTEGYPINVFWVREVDHIVRNEDEVTRMVNDGWQFNPSTPGVGDFMYKDTNGDKVIDDNDRVIKGNPIPLYTYNANLSVEYKGFDFYVLLDGVAKWDKYLQGDLYSLDHLAGTYLWPKSYLHTTWTVDNPNANIPKLYSNDTKNNQTSDFFLHKADYLKIRSLQLGYTIPPKLTKTIKLDNVRFYVNLENYFIFTSFPGQDPENTPASGLQQTYPSMKSISFGCNLSF